jgi:hypothetical protein
MKTIVLLIVAIAFAAGIILASILVILPSSSGSNIDPKLADQNKGDALYLYLFKENSDLRDSGGGGYYMLYDDMTDGIGQITKPSFEQMHYGIGTDGVYKNWLSDIRIERFSSVIMIISDSIKKPDGSPLKQEDFSPEARFFYSPYFRATLIFENDGTVHVYDQDTYNNPNHLPPERMIGVVTLPVEAVDFKRINSNYEEIKERVESYKPRQLQSPPATILQDEPKDFFDDLVLVAQTTNGVATIPSSDPLGGDNYSNDTNGISLRLYHGVNATSGSEIVAASLSNPAEGRTISVYQLAISGYVSIGDGSAESMLLDRPLISDKYNAIEPTTTNPITILAGESITAYIEGDSFDIDRYAASACYSYVDVDSSDRTNSDKELSNRYCFNATQQK